MRHSWALGPEDTAGGKEPEDNWPPSNCPRASLAPPCPGEPAGYSPMEQKNAVVPSHTMVFSADSQTLSHSLLQRESSEVDSTGRSRSSEALTFLPQHKFPAPALWLSSFPCRFGRWRECWGKRLHIKERKSQPINYQNWINKVCLGNKVLEEGETDTCGAVKLERNVSKTNYKPSKYRITHEWMAIITHQSNPTCVLDLVFHHVESSPGSLISTLGSRYRGTRGVRGCWFCLNIVIHFLTHFSFSSLILLEMTSAEKQSAFF